MFNCFNSWKLSFFDLVHKFPWFFSLVQDFLYFGIKKSSFGILDCFLEILPILQVSWGSIYLQISLAVFIPLQFQMFSDIDHFWMFEPDVIHIVHDFLYNMLKIFLAIDMISIKSFDQLNNFSNEIDLFFTIFNNCSFSSLDIFFKNWNSHCKWDMIWW